MNPGSAHFLSQHSSPALHHYLHHHYFHQSQCPPALNKHCLLSQLPFVAVGNCTLSAEPAMISLPVIENVIAPVQKQKW